MKTKTLKRSNVAKTPKPDPDPLAVAVAMEPPTIPPELVKPTVVPTPPITWHTVEVLAPAGYTFGVVRDNDGILVISMKPPGGNWPDALEDRPKFPQTVVKIKEGDKCYRTVAMGK